MRAATKKLSDMGLSFFEILALVSKYQEFFLPLLKQIIDALKNKTPLPEVPKKK